MSLKTSAPKTLTDIITDTSDTLRAMKGFRGAKEQDEYKGLMPNNAVRKATDPDYRPFSPREKP